jgi:hypothetical protein
MADAPDHPAIEDIHDPNPPVKGHIDVATQMLHDTYKRAKIQKSGSINIKETLKIKDKDINFY